VYKRQLLKVSIMSFMIALTPVSWDICEPNWDKARFIN
jgi:hypothetical protein